MHYYMTTSNKFAKRYILQYSACSLYYSDWSPSIGTVSTNTEAWKPYYPLVLLSVANCSDF
jgi:hypothetical protein